MSEPAANTVKAWKKEEEKSFLLQCIEVYRSLPALWKVKSDEYKDRDKKAQAWTTLLEVYQEKYPSATEDDVKKRFNSLRTNFRTELKKVLASRKSGTDPDSLYESTKWFYECLVGTEILCNIFV
ncbi:UNVERIFIED_CONTAM: hypothetical protein RMT77_010107 [Armadillidium vulgare]